MRNTLVASSLLLCLCAVGCARGPAPPAVGSKVVMSLPYSAYSSAEAMRRQGPRSSYLGDVWTGDLVEVVEAGEDYAVVTVVKTREGNPGKVQGYIRRWWK